MGQILVRNLRGEAIETLKDRARRNGRSLEAEVRAILESAATRDVASTRVAAARIRRRLASAPRLDSARLIRQDRER